ncbi:MAG: hypothetical protein LC114_09765 [Bryobacterales bacterium]|nr:hypothetical protein [Bryobacterales bacterium]
MPGAYNPPSNAHVAMALRAAQMADEVLLLLPENFPHKQFRDAGFESRLSLMERAVNHQKISVGSASGGLFLEMLQDVVEAFPESNPAFVCGSDAAQRMLDWPYDEAGVLERFFSRATLWVFARQGTFEPPREFAGRIATFGFEESLRTISSTEIRRRIAAGEEWKTLAPESIHGEIERLYGQGDR